MSFYPPFISLLAHNQPQLISNHLKTTCSQQPNLHLPFYLSCFSLLFLVFAVFVLCCPTFALSFHSTAYRFVFAVFLCSVACFSWSLSLHHYSSTLLYSYPDNNGGLTRTRVQQHDSQRNHSADRWMLSITAMAPK